ncbi:GD19761 [Drosophila simulans]|uniref:GD19761 n=1 Tax=Drosophila simulans TaxID=7240 RepID=B4QW76_DROSI|nr:GD19761 [Drosophila simulans]
MGEENWLGINNEIPATGENDNEFAEHGPPESGRTEPAMEFRIQLRTFNQFSGPFREVEILKAKQSRAPSKSDTVGSRNGELAEREPGIGKLPTRNTLDTARAQAPRKDAGFEIRDWDWGFGMRDTVSRARLYRQLRSSPESAGGSCHRPALLLLLAAPFAGFRQPLSTHFTT